MSQQNPKPEKEIEVQTPADPQTPAQPDPLTEPEIETLFGGADVEVAPQGAPAEEPNKEDESLVFGKKRTWGETPAAEPAQKGDEKALTEEELDKLFPEEQPEETAPAEEPEDESLVFGKKRTWGDEATK